MTASMHLDGANVLDKAGALERLGDDEGFWAEIMDAFLDATPADLAELRTASDAQDFQQVARVAHRVRGAASNIGAVAIESLAGKIEHDAADAASSVAQDVSQLEQELERLRACVSTLTVHG